MANIEIAVKAQSAADESLAFQNCVDGRQQIAQGERLMNIASRALTQSLLHYVGIGLLADEEELCTGCKPAYSLGGFYAIQFRQANVHQNQIRLQLLGHLDSLHSVGSLDDLELRPLFKGKANELTKRSKVLDDENFGGGHRKWIRALSSLVNHRFVNTDRWLQIAILPSGDYSGRII